MKRIATLSLCFVSLYVNAQTVKLETGKKLTSVSSRKLDMDMGEGGQMTLESSKTSLITITGADAASYKANTTTVKMKVSQEVAGESMNYDSENKGDTSELARTFSADLNQMDPILIDKATGFVKDDSPEKTVETPDENPLASIVGSNSPASGLSTTFFVIPAGKKVGNTWIDSTSKDGMKVVRNYEYQSLEKGTATVVIKSATKGMIEKEAQGMQFVINLTGTSQSVYTMDSATGLVKKSTTTGSMDGSMDVMGQSMPLTVTMSSNSSVE